MKFKVSSMHSLKKNTQKAGNYVRWETLHMSRFFRIRSVRRVSLHVYRYALSGCNHNRHVAEHGFEVGKHIFGVWT